MRVSIRHLTLLVAAAGAAASVGLAPVAHAGADEKVCRDAGSVLCQRPGPSSTSPGAPDPATQQLLGGNMPNPLPGLAGIN